MTTVVTRHTSLIVITLAVVATFSFSYALMQSPAQTQTASSGHLSRTHQPNALPKLSTTQQATMAPINASAASQPQLTNTSSTSSVASALNTTTPQTGAQTTKNLQAAPQSSQASGASGTDSAKKVTDGLLKPTKMLVTPINNFAHKVLPSL